MQASTRAKYLFVLFVVAAGCLLLGRGFSTNYTKHLPAQIEIQKPVYPDPPARVDVNGVAFTIEEDDMILNGPNYYGYTDCVRHRIFVRRKTDVPLELMHELSHALVCYMGPDGANVNNMYFNSSSNTLHEGIYRFSDAWRELFLRNPGLAEYLSSPSEN